MHIATFCSHLEPCNNMRRAFSVEKDALEVLKKRFIAILNL